MSDAPAPFSLVRILRRLAGSATDEPSPVDLQEVFGHLEAVARASGRESLELALSALMSLTGAPRGFIATRDPEGELRFVAARAFAALDLSNPEAQLSKSILDAALADAGLLVVDDAARDARFADAASVQSLGLRAVMCAPLVHEGHPFGVLYLDDPTSAARFDTPKREACSEFSTLIAPIVARELELERLRRSHRARLDALGRSNALEGFVAGSTEMVEVLETLTRVAQTRANLLVRGETGTGKTRCARYVHLRSERRDGPFITANCRALAHEGREDSIFSIGSPRGSLFEAADGGTLVLDEVSSLGASAQARLVATIESGRPTVGADDAGTDSPASGALSVRVIATTRVDLSELCATGAFREDLRLRLGAVEVELPPLRLRGPDILELADARLAAARLSREPQAPTAARFTPAARIALSSYLWPGNVRELESLVERAAILSDEASIDIDQLPPELWGPTQEQPNLNLRKSVKSFKRRLVQQARAAAEGDHKTTAALLGVNAKYLYQLVKELELDG